MLKNNTFLETIIDQNFVFWHPKIKAKSTGFNIKGGKPPSLVELAIIDLKKGNRNFGHSILPKIQNRGKYFGKGKHCSNLSLGLKGLPPFV